jgi:hypothetical protein
MTKTNPAPPPSLEDAKAFFVKQGKWDFAERFDGWQCCELMADFARQRESAIRADEREKVAARLEKYEAALRHYADESFWEHHSSGVDGTEKRQYKAVCYNGTEQGNGYDIASAALQEGK